MPLIDRILTIAVTATITSLIWIVVGGSLIENATGESQRGTTRPADAVPSPSSSQTAAGVAELSRDESEGKSLDGVADTSAGESSARLMIPVLNIRPDDLTDTFSASREGGSRLHEAIDIMAPSGTTVLSAAPGTIERLYQSTAGGNTIYVRSTDGETIYYYAHLDNYAEGLRKGQQIRRGQRLGTVGSSGNASDDAPHLHFAVLETTEDAEWWEPAHAVNPYPLLTGGR